MSMHYWAVRPISQRGYGGSIRIEKAETPRRACELAFGRGVHPNTWEAKDMGTRVALIQSDNKRIAMLKDPTGWETI